MKRDFKVTGYFYNQGDNGYRKYLDIRKDNSMSTQPDIMIIMMNPGSSKHTDDKEQSYNSEVDAEPDFTQYRIMDVMDNCDYKYARVLNLSDLRIIKSSDLYKNPDYLKSKTHSIFCKERRLELDKLFIPDVPVIVGWGVSKKLEPFRNLAWEYLAGRKVIGKRKNGSENCFYHPLRRINSKIQEISWVDEISAQIQEVCK
jgi:Protein of unknown function (DUF1643)